MAESEKAVEEPLLWERLRFFLRATTMRWQEDGTLAVLAVLSFVLSIMTFATYFLSSPETVAPGPEDELVAVIAWTDYEGSCIEDVRLHYLYDNGKYDHGPPYRKVHCRNGPSASMP